MKVYCSDCKFYKKGKCFAKENQKKVSTYLRKETDLIRAPFIINENNDCVFYKAK